MVEAISNIIWLLILVVSFYGAGDIIFRLFKIEIEEHILVSIALGCILFIYAIAILGFLGLLYPVALYIVIMPSFLAGVITFIKNKSDILNTSKDFFIARRKNIFLYILLAYIVVYLLSNLAPSLDGDTTGYCLVVPKVFVEAHKIITIPHIPLSNLPGNIFMLSALGLVIKGEVLSLLLSGFFMGLGCILVILAIAKRYFSLKRGILASLIFYSTGVVAFLNPTTKAGLGWCFFDLLGVYVFSLWYSEKKSLKSSKIYLLLTGIFLGAAFGSKYTALYSISIITFFLMLKTYQEDRSILSCQHNLFYYFFPIVIMASPWFIKNFIIAGNPVYPVFEFSNTDIPKHTSGLFGIFKTIWDGSTGYIAGGMGKPWGPIFLAFLPFLIIKAKNQRYIRIGGIYSFLYFLLWYTGVQRGRHALPMLSILSVLTAYAVFDIAKQKDIVWKVSLFLLMCYFLFNLAIYTRLHFFNIRKFDYILGQDKREDFLKKNLKLYPEYPNYPMIEFINTNLPKNARIASVLNANAYYIERPMKQIAHLPSKGAVYELKQLNQEGINYIWVNDFLLSRYKEGYAGYPHFSDSAFENRNFVSRYFILLYEEKGQKLYKISCNNIKSDE